MHQRPNALRLRLFIKAPDAINTLGQDLAQVLPIAREAEPQMHDKNVQTMTTRQVLNENPKDA